MTIVRTTATAILRPIVSLEHHRCVATFVFTLLGPNTSRLNFLPAVDLGAATVGCRWVDVGSGVYRD